jgi:hypothetical protein
MAAAPATELPMPEPAQVPLNEIPIVPIAQIGGKLLNGGELVNLAEYASRRAEKFGATIASLRQASPPAPQRQPRALRGPTSRRKRRSRPQPRWRPRPGSR